MKPFGKYVLVIATALSVALMAFILGFVVMDFAWTHFVVTNPRELSPADGVVVIGGGFLFGIAFGATGFGLVLYRFWPSRLGQNLP